MSSVWTGQVQDFCKVSGDSAAAFCREVIGGTLTLDPHTISKRGIAAQVHSRKGVLEATLEVRCIGVRKEDLALWFPTTRGVQVVNFPSFYVAADDGSNSYAVLLSDAQPGSITIEQSDGEDAEVEINLTLKAATVDPDASSLTPSYNSMAGHTASDTVITIGSELGVLSWSLSNDLGLKMWNPRNIKTTKALPFGYVITQQDPRFQAVCSDSGYLADMLADDWIPTDIVIAMANGTQAEDIEITLSGFILSNWSAPFEPEGIVGHTHEWVPGSGNQYGRVLFSGVGS